MHNIYFARHGETVWNVENKICGMTDSPLTERGRQQARKLRLENDAAEAAAQAALPDKTDAENQEGSGE